MVSRQAADDGFDRAANVLGALALAVTDRVADATAEAAGRSDSAAAALSALLHFLEGPSVDQLRQVLGLTSSGTVRLVDRLEADGLVRRIGADDRRSSLIALTARGRREASRVADARAAVLTSALAQLSRSERRTVEELLGKVLAGLTRTEGATKWTCRMCDTGVCWAKPGDCPFALVTGRTGQTSPSG